MPTPQSAIPCTECTFDPENWTRQDAVRTIGLAAPHLASYAIENCSPATVNTRSGADEVSILGHLHNLACLFRLHRLAHGSVGSPANRDADTRQNPADLDVTDVLDSLATESTGLFEMHRGLGDDEWAEDIEVDGRKHSVESSLRFLVHEMTHALHEIAKTRHNLGDTVPVMSGTVEQINVSNGGVPKTAVDRATVGPSGLTADTQAARQHHGRPWQALCLYSAEVVEALRAEGHPIGFGSVGENLTVRGLDWSKMRSGLEVNIGDIRARITAPAVPCSKNHQWFSDQNSDRISHDSHPGWSRWYALVVSGGDVVTGADMTVGSAVS